MNVTLTQAELQCILSALVDRHEALKDGNTADEAFHGRAWADAEITRLQALILKFS